MSAKKQSSKVVPCDIHEKRFFKLAYRMAVSRQCKTGQQLELVNASQHYKVCRKIILGILTPEHGLIPNERLENIALMHRIMRSGSALLEKLCLRFDYLVHEANAAPNPDQLPILTGQASTERSRESDTHSRAQLMSAYDYFACTYLGRGINVASLLARIVQMSLKEVRWIHYHGFARIAEEALTPEK